MHIKMFVVLNLSKINWRMKHLIQPKIQQYPFMTSYGTDLSQLTNLMLVALMLETLMT